MGSPALTACFRVFPQGELRFPYKETVVTIEGNDRYH